DAAGAIPASRAGTRDSGLRTLRRNRSRAGRRLGGGRPLSQGNARRDVLAVLVEVTQRRLLSDLERAAGDRRRGGPNELRFLSGRVLTAKGLLRFLDRRDCPGQRIAVRLDLVRRIARWPREGHGEKGHDPDSDQRALSFTPTIWPAE